MDDDKEAAERRHVLQHVQEPRAPEGYGFLRVTGYLPGEKDCYVSASQVRKFGRRKGDIVSGPIRPPRSKEKFPALTRIELVNGMTVEDARKRPKFGSLTPLFPDERLRLEVDGEPNHVLARIVDLISPIGKGQRGLIASPPRRARRPCSRRSPTRSPSTTRSATSWSCSLTSGRKRSPICSALCAVRWFPRPSMNLRPGT